MLGRTIPTLCLLCLYACAGGPRSNVSAVVFETESRKEPHQTDSPVHAAIARSQVAVRIVDWAIDFTTPAAPLITYSRTLGQSEGLCDGEAFADQIAPGSCSATLIDERHLLTAAHCVSDPNECDGSHYWVFGFEMQSDGVLAPLGADDVYTCTQILVASRPNDFAVVELDRPVSGRTPVPTRITRTGLPLGSPLNLIGFPSGVPVKVDRDGEVTSSIRGGTFLGTVDAFSSSSGSGVFDDEGRLIGFLQGGLTDYVAEGDCNVVNVIDPPEPGTGERMAYLDLVLAAYCELRGASSALCACGGAPCVDEPSLDAGTDGGSVDAGPGDGSVDSSLADALTAPDVSGDSGTVDAADSGGCALAGSSPPLPLSPLVLFGLLLFWRRRPNRPGTST